MKEVAHLCLRSHSVHSTGTARRSQRRIYVWWRFTRGPIVLLSVVGLESVPTFVSNRFHGSLRRWHDIWLETRLEFAPEVPFPLMLQSETLFATVQYQQSRPYDCKPPSQELVWVPRCAKTKQPSKGTTERQNLLPGTTEVKIKVNSKNTHNTVVSAVK